MTQVWTPQEDEEYEVYPEAGPIMTAEDGAWTPEVQEDFTAGLLSVDEADMLVLWGTL